MQHDADWDGMLVSLPSIDKMAHMWGTDDTGPSGVGDDVDEFAHLPQAARIADDRSASCSVSSRRRDSTTRRSSC